MTTIEIKTSAKNGTKLYYVDNKRVSRDIALEAAANIRNDLFTIETGSWNDYTKAVEYKMLMRTKQCPIKIQQESHRYDIIFRVLVDDVVVKSFIECKTDVNSIKQTKQDLTAFANKIAYAYINGAYGIRIRGRYDIEILNAPVVEADVDDYIVTPDAQEVAIDAEQTEADNNIMAIETDGSEDDSDYNVFDLIPDISELNDVDDYAVTTDAQKVAIDAEQQQADCNRDSLLAEIAKYQAAYDNACERDDWLKINGEYVSFWGNKVRCIRSERFDAYIEYFYSYAGKKSRRFNYRGAVVKKDKFFECIANEERASEQLDAFRKFDKDNNTDRHSDYIACPSFKFRVNIYYTYANGKESASELYYDSFDQALAYLHNFKAFAATEQLIFSAKIQENRICGEVFFGIRKDEQEFFTDKYYTDIANHEPTEQENTDNITSEQTREYKYYVTSNLPIADASPAGFIKASDGINKFVVYDHPLTISQIVGYYLVPDIGNSESLEDIDTDWDFGSSIDCLADWRKRQTLDIERATRITVDIETDGSEDDSTDDNTFDLLPDVSELNDVDDTPAKLDETPPVAYYRIIGREHFKIGDEDGDVITFIDGAWYSIFSNKYGAVIRRNSPEQIEFYIIQYLPGYGEKQERVDEYDFWRILEEAGSCQLDSDFENYCRDAKADTNFLTESIIDTLDDIAHCDDPDLADGYVNVLVDLFTDLRDVNYGVYQAFVSIIANQIDNSPAVSVIDNPQAEQLPDTLTSIFNTCAEYNSHAPAGWEIRFDSEHNNYPIEFNGVSVAKVDSLAVLKFLKPDEFFDQFRTLIDKSYSERQQFIDRCKKELREWDDVRCEMVAIYGEDLERLKTIDDMIAQIKRDMFIAEIAG